MTKLQGNTSCEEEKQVFGMRQKANCTVLLSRGEEEEEEEETRAQAIPYVK